MADIGESRAALGAMSGSIVCRASWTPPFDTRPALRTGELPGGGDAEHGEGAASILEARVGEPAAGDLVTSAGEAVGELGVAFLLLLIEAEIMVLERGVEVAPPARVQNEGKPTTTGGASAETQRTRRRRSGLAHRITDPVKLGSMTSRVSRAGEWQGEARLTTVCCRGLPCRKGLA